MGGLDQAIADLGSGAGLAVCLIVALLLGLRHATDPDHLTAVSTLVASDPTGGVRRARRLGLAWGAGHAVTLVALGLPVVLLGSSLPEPVQTAAEIAVGVMIVALALRLLIRWRRGYFHVHEHRHGEVVHAHPHAHEGEHADSHPHDHPEQLGRSPAAAFGIGLVHGVGGSGGATILLVGAVSDGPEAALALVIFAVATAISMALLSTLVGSALVRPLLWRRLGAAAPVMGGSSLAFGLWYGLGAAGVLPYVL
jgi:ABC-type nickel/cobalt efflux system permease component RcnA